MSIRLLPKLFLLAALGLGISGCTSASKPVQGIEAWTAGLNCAQAPQAVDDAFVRRVDPQGELRSVALVVHGLNTLPERMDALAAVLNQSGIATRRISLPGHRHDPESFKSVTRERWIEDMLGAYCRARFEADQKKVPLLVLGFSLGAAVALDLLETAPAGAIRYDGLILLAPAIEIRARSRLIQGFRLFGRTYVIGSRNHPAYRANEGTPVAAYDSLFEIVDHLHETGFARSNLPALVLVDPEDELVSASGLKELIRDRKLDRWTLVEISKTDASLDPNHHHLILDEASLGARAWVELKDRIRGFVSTFK